MFIKTVYFKRSTIGQILHNHLSPIIHYLIINRKGIANFAMEKIGLLFITLGTINAVFTENLTNAVLGPQSERFRIR